jgi:hypothetical protein
VLEGEQVPTVQRYNVNQKFYILRLADRQTHTLTNRPVFTYVGESERSRKSRWAEHESGARPDTGRPLRGRLYGPAYPGFNEV